MKVICIDNNNPIHPHLMKEQDMICEGEIYTVTTEVQRPNGLFYILAERMLYPKPVLYQAKRFIPLSNIDETKESNYNELRKIKPFDLV
jgi:hypothetical protein